MHLQEGSDEFGVLNGTCFHSSDGEVVYTSNHVHCVDIGGMVTTKDDVQFVKVFRD